MCFDQNDIEWWFQKIGSMSHVLKTNSPHKYTHIGYNLKLMTKILKKPRQYYSGRKWF
jgi:hypothetical protein